MSAFRYNIGFAEVIAGPDLLIRRDAQGLATATQTFTIRVEDKNTPQIQEAFSRGTPITTVNPTLDASYNYLEVEEREFQDIPGGYTQVFCTFSGYDEGSDYDTDRETTYTLRGVTTERPIIEHPNYLAEVRDAGSTQEHLAIVALYKQEAYVVDTNAANPEVRDKSNDALIILQITDPNAVKWYEKIFVDGVRTYDAPLYEWTKEKANAGGLGNSDLNGFGREQAPEGNPPEPPEDGWWQYTDVTEVTGSNGSSWSKTWRWNYGDVDTDIYG